MKNFMFLAITLLITLGSCQKEKEEISPVMDEASSIVTNDSTSVSRGDPKAGNNTWIMNTTSMNQIPSQLFSVDYKYKTSYQHKLMNYINGFGKCSWTSYVIAAACIIKGNCNWCSYPVNDTKVNQVMNKCVQYAGSYADGAAITNIKWYCQNQDYLKLSCYQKSTYNNSSGRFEAIKFMLDHLLAKHSPFLVISTSGTKGHYLIVHAINWKCGGTGSTVYYTDCLSIASGNNTSYSSNIKTMDLSSFLNKMVNAPNMYNMFFLWTKPY